MGLAPSRKLRRDWGKTCRATKEAVPGSMHLSSAEAAGFVGQPARAGPGPGG